MRPMQEANTEPLCHMVKQPCWPTKNRVHLVATLVVSRCFQPLMTQPLTRCLKLLQSCLSVS